MLLSSYLTKISPEGLLIRIYPNRKQARRTQMRRILQEGRRHTRGTFNISSHSHPFHALRLPPTFSRPPLLPASLGLRFIRIGRKGEDGPHFSTQKDETKRAPQRTSLSPYEIVATKLGRFDRQLQALQVDAEGEVSTCTTSIKELLLDTQMHVRDLIALSPEALRKRGGRLTPCILPRKDVIVFVMHPLRLVISKNSCLAFDPGDPTVQSVIADISSAIKIQQLERAHLAKSGNGSVLEPYAISYELVVLEQALRSFCNQFSRIKELLGLIVETSLKALVDSQGSDQEEQLYRLVPLKDVLAVAQHNMQEAVGVLQQLVDCDEDMLAMLLTEKAALQKEKARVSSQAARLDLNLHSDVELLLENYLRELILTGQQIKMLQARVQSAQEVFSINVDLMRNRVLRITLLLTILSTSLASAATIGAFFGMNVRLPESLETHPEAFAWITVGSICLGAGLFALAVAFARGHGKDRVRRDLQSVAAFQSIFKHIRSVSQAIYQTSLDPKEVAMGKTKESRAYFRKMLSAHRNYEVSWEEVDVLMDVLGASADQFRQQQKYSDETSEATIYRKLFESLAAQERQETSGDEDLEAAGREARDRVAEARRERPPV